MHREVNGTITIEFTTFVDEDYDKASVMVARIKDLIEEELEEIIDIINAKTPVEVDMFDVEMEL